VAKHRPTFVVSARAAAIPGLASLLNQVATIVDVEKGRPPDLVDGYVIAWGDQPPQGRLVTGLVLVVSITGSEDQHRWALQLGAAAVIDPSMSPAKFDAMWACVLAGLCPLPRRSAELLARRLAEPPKGLVVSPRDRIILEVLVSGGTVAAVADQLECSARHARRHIHSLWERFGVATRAQGLVAAARWGLID